MVGNFYELTASTSDRSTKIPSVDTMWSRNETFPVKTHTFELRTRLPLDYSLHKGLFMILHYFQVDKNIIAEDYNESVDIVFEDTLR